MHWANELFTLTADITATSSERRVQNACSELQPPALLSVFRERSNLHFASMDDGSESCAETWFARKFFKAMRPPSYMHQSGWTLTAVNSFPLLSQAHTDSRFDELYGLLKFWFAGDPLIDD